MINKAILVGRLTADPELRFTQSNTPVCTMRLATNDSWFDKASGERKESAEFHRVVVWGPQAEPCEKYLKKGRLVYVEGSLQTKEWQDKDGVKRWTTEIRATSVKFLEFGDSQGQGDSQSSGEGRPSRGGSTGSAGGGGGSNRSGGGGGSKPRGPNAPGPAEDGGFADDDAPFTYAHLRHKDMALTYTGMRGVFE